MLTACMLANQLREQELSLQNVLSLSLVHLCGTLYLQSADLRLEPDTAVFKRILPVSFCFSVIFSVLT